MGFKAVGIFLHNSCVSVDENSLLKRQTALQLPYGFLPAVCSLVLNKTCIFLCFWARISPVHLCTSTHISIMTNGDWDKDC